MGADGCVWSSDDTVIKSPNDRRLYRVIQLENGLCALLVHDPDICSDDSKTLDNPEDEQDDVEEGQSDYEDEDEESEEDEEDEDDDKGNGTSSQTKKVSSYSFQIRFSVLDFKC